MAALDREISNATPKDSKAWLFQMSDEPAVLVKHVAESLFVQPFMLSLCRKQVRDVTPRRSSSDPPLP